jgi:N-acetylglucosaminyl-diphospho-decaprenol L-rhamnosyltransferase
VTAIAVVIVTHDTLDELAGCLATVALAGGDEVVVVDSGSSDGTADFVRRHHPTVRLLELANVGFARGANAGIRASTAPVVVVSNADVRFAPGSLARLAATLHGDPGLAAVGPGVVYPDGGYQASARTEPSGGTALGHALLGRVLPGNRWTRRYRQLDADPAAPRDVDWLSGCALALRRDAVVAVGGFDPGYFLYVEDVDLGARLRGAGWRLRYEPAAQVTHRVGASTRAKRWRSLRAHARSLDRYHARRSGGTLPGRLARPFVRAGLLVWVPVTWLLERVARRPRSTTGEWTDGPSHLASPGDHPAATSVPETRTSRA